MYKYNIKNAVHWQSPGVTGEALVNVWDHFYQNQEKLLSCRQNIVFLITGGHNHCDEPLHILQGADQNGTAYTYPDSQVFKGRSYFDDFSGYLQSVKDNPGEEWRDLKKAVHVAKYLYEDHIGGAYDSPLYHTPNADDPADRCLLGNCEGNRIRVYPISFVSTSSMLNEIAQAAGGGASSVDATDKNAMLKYIRDIVKSVPTKSLTSAVPALSYSGNSFGNRIFIPAFQVMSPGHWWGTINKLCMIGEANENCLFLNSVNQDGSHEFNPSAVELFSSNLYNATNANDISNGFITGVNKVLTDDIVAEPGSYRNIFFYSEADSLIHSATDQAFYDNASGTTTSGKLKNFMQGCEHEDGNCVPRKNPLGDFWHSSPLYLEFNGGKYVVAGSNSGFLHVFDADTGKEIKAVVPNYDIAITKHLAGNSYATESSRENTYGVDLSPTRLSSPSSGDWIAAGFRRGGEEGRGYLFMKTEDLLSSGTSMDGTFAIRLGPCSDTTKTTEADCLAAGAMWNMIGQSWAVPSLYPVTGDNPHIVVPYGYDVWFDNDDFLPEDYPGTKIQVIEGKMSTEALTDPKFLSADFKTDFLGGEKIDAKYPAVGRVYPVKNTHCSDPLYATRNECESNWKVWRFEEGAGEDASVQSISDATGYYYADIFGSVFYYDTRGDRYSKIFEISSISGQDYGREKNSDMLKLFGSVKPVIRIGHEDRAGTEDDLHDREEWVFFGTGDITRLKR